MMAEFHVVPLGGSIHLSGRLAKVMRLIDASGLDYRVGPMGTVLEGEWDHVMDLIKRCHKALLADCPRVVTSIAIDDRKGAFSGRMKKKVDSVIRKSGRNLRT